MQLIDCFFQCKMWISIPMSRLDKSKQKEISLKKNININKNDCSFVPISVL